MLLRERSLTLDRSLSQRTEKASSPMLLPAKFNSVNAHPFIASRRKVEEKKVEEVEDENEKDNEKEKEKREVMKRR